jgi:hypothetical protein
MYKTLIVAHTSDFNTITILPSKEDNSAPRPINSFHFVESKGDIKDQVESILQEEAGADSIKGFTLKNQQHGVDYYLVRFNLEQKASKLIAA